MTKVKIARRIFIICCIATFCSMFLPWFTFNWEMTGAYWGYQMIAPVGIVLAVMMWQLYLKENGPVNILLMEFMVLSIPCLFLFSFATWHIPFITGHVDLAVSLHTAMPTFWVALGLSVVMVCAYQVVLVCSKEK